MAAYIFGKTYEAWLQGNVDLDGNVKILLVSTGTEPGDWTPAENTDEFLADIPAGGRVSASGNLANKTFTLGWFDSDPVVFSGLTGEEIEAFVIYLDTGVEGTSRLIFFCDTASGSPGLPLTPNGGNATLTPDTNGWFHL
ncbi:MAG: hypothetical protein IT437_08685 [Phycisphaerales bacterium]|nr:hypothetical protein [Steroidobacteraceae bacterium]MCC6660948.1 hypothetical protein [Phycisphaerales bacterium]